MTLRSYFAGTVEAAVDQARDELGPEAMLVGSRKTDAEAKHLGEYEVTFGQLPAPGDAAGRRAAFEPVFREQTASLNAQAAMRAEIAEMRRQFREMRRAVLQAGAAAHSPVAARALSLLADAGVEAQLSREIASMVELRLAGEPPASAFGGRLDSAVAAEMESRLRVDASVGVSGASARVAALVGPPGAGKTTTLVKLAVSAGLAAGRAVQLLTMDTWRVAAVEQLRSYAAILGAGFQVVETGRALERAIDEPGGKDLILIDTPGFGARDMDGAIDVADALAANPAVDVHLVLPASMTPADLNLVVDRFAIFRPAKLLFTRIDEAGSLGALFSEAARTGLPVSFLADGQQVPEDLRPACRGWIVGRIVNREGESALSAA